MDKLIRGLLEMTKLEQNYLQLKLEHIPLGEVCQEIVGRYQHISEEKSITVWLLHTFQRVLDFRQVYVIINYEMCLNACW